MKSDYSYKEFEMIKKLSPYWAKLIEDDKDGGLPAPNVLQHVAMECFLNGYWGPTVESLKRCIRANNDCHPLRKTKEYDDLIDICEV